MFLSMQNTSQWRVQSRLCLVIISPYYYSLTWAKLCAAATFAAQKQQSLWPSCLSINEPSLLLPMISFKRKPTFFIFRTRFLFRFSCFQSKRFFLINRRPKCLSFESEGTTLSWVSRVIHLNREFLCFGKLFFVRAGFLRTFYRCKLKTSSTV